MAVEKGNPAESFCHGDHFLLKMQECFHLIKLGQALIESAKATKSYVSDTWKCVRAAFPILDK